HDNLKITKRSLHVDEFTILRGQAERDLAHTLPVHEIHVRCRFCIFEQTYDPHTVPAWVQPFLDQIAELEKQELREELLTQLTEPIDLMLLDKLLDAEVDPSLLVGKQADWHGEVFPIVHLANGRIAIHVTLTCAVCHKASITAYVGSGLHSGAFCYVFSFEGE